MFDYNAFVQGYNTGTQKRLNVSSPRQNALVETSDILTFNHLEKHKNRYGFEFGKMYDGEVLAHEALKEIARKMVILHPDTPIKYLLTGRKYNSSGEFETCQTKSEKPRTGSCNAYVMFTPSEVKKIFWQLTTLRESGQAFSKKYMDQELFRFRNIFKEALLKNKAVYVYGHN